MGAPHGRDSRGHGPLLQVRDLRIAYGATHVVDGVSLDLAAGESLAIVGGSGSGKTQTALSLLGLLDRSARVSGSIAFEGRELLGLPESGLNALRGARIGMVFQDALSSLNPHLTLGAQIAETLIWHRKLPRAEALREALGLLEAVRIADAPRRLRQYPHECSGGMRQRALIAMALACKPALLIADEPTTALDVTVQAQILHLLAELRERLGLALLLISHDLGVVSQLCRHVLVLQGGRVVEEGAAVDLLSRPQHPYTRELVRLRPSLV
jgi:ABC-type microcin C transport system duplicated ATPase subunit YejF